MGELPPQGEQQAPGEDNQEAEEEVEIEELVHQPEGVEVHQPEVVENEEVAHQPAGVEPLGGDDVRPANAVQPGYLTLGVTRSTIQQDERA